MNTKDFFVAGVVYLLCVFVLYPGGFMDNYCVYLDDFCDPFFDILPPRDYSCAKSIHLQVEITNMLEKSDPPLAYTFQRRGMCDFKVILDDSTELVSFKNSPRFLIKLQGDRITNETEFFNKLSKKMERLQLEVDGFKCTLCDRCYNSFTSRKNTYTVDILSIKND